MRRCRALFVAAWFILPGFTTAYCQNPELIVQTGHTNAINSLAFSPDGRVLATGSHDTTIKLWDVRTGLELRTFRGHTNTVTSIVFSPNRNTLITASLDASIRFWRIDTGKIVRVIPQSGSINSIAISPDGKLLASGGWDHTVTLWNVDDGSKIRVLRGHLSSVNSVAFSPTGGLLATGSDDNSIKFWQVDSGREVRTLAIKSSGDHPSRFVDINTGEATSPPTGAPPGLVGIVTESVNSVSFSPDGEKLASLSLSVRNFDLNGIDFTIKLWDVKNGKEIRTLETFPGGGQSGKFIFENTDHNALVGGVSFSADGNTLIARAADYTVKTWEVATGKVTSQLPIITFSDDPVRAKEIREQFERITWKFNPHLPTLSPDGKTFAVAVENVVSLWDIQLGRSIRAFAGHASSVRSVAFDPRSKILANSTDALPTRLWDLAKGKVLRTLDRKAFPYGAFSVAFSPSQNILVTASPDVYGTKATIEVWDLSTGVRRSAFTESSSGEFSLAFAPDGKSLAAGGLRDTVAIWDVLAGQTIRDFEQTNFPSNVVALSPDGKILAHAAWGEHTEKSIPQNTDLAPANDQNLKALLKMDFSPSLKVWDVGSGRAILQIKEKDRAFYAVTFSRDSKVLAAGSSDDAVCLWNVQTGQKLRELKGNKDSFYALSFSPDGKLLAGSGSGGLIYLWDAATGTQISILKGHSGAVRSLSFNIDGSILASGSDDGTIKLWSVANKKELAALFPLDQHGWVVVDPEGRFDTGDLDQVKGLAWVFPDEPFTPLAPETFMRDYYTPQLLPELIGGQHLTEIPSLSALNRVQPSVAVVDVKAEPGPVGTVVVSVEVTSARSDVQKDERGDYLESGVYDVRLFRDGQTVGQWPEVGAAERTGRIVRAEDREAWRQRHRVKLDASGTATITFHHVRLPHRRGVRNAEFAAYAFNSDRVKSLTTSPFEYPVPSEVAAGVLQRGYLVTMGVNANQSHNLDLELAVSSAERARALLRSKLKADYTEVVEIPLYSDLAPDSNQVRLKTASKADLRTVLDLLAGRSVDPRLRDEVDPKHRLRAASPDDGVVLYVASHGYADPKGTFYLMPYDTGANWGITEDVLTRCQSSPDRSVACKQAEDLLAHSVSSADLTAWWSGVDAGDMLMILDSCHSGAVPGKEFRPGPLGDPGFGQLSYDKGMQILSASQPAQTEQGEWVSGGEGRTLLVDALEIVAKLSPQHTLERWLQDTEQQLPITATQLYPALKEEDVQTPLLLDFAKKANVATIAEQ